MRHRNEKADPVIRPPDRRIDTCEGGTDMGDSTNVLRFPTPVQHRVDRAAIQAVRFLAGADLVTEQVAVRALEDFGASETEIDHVRAILAVRRGRL
jgi:hypothetical protein